MWLPVNPTPPRVFDSSRFSDTTQHVTHAEASIESVVVAIPNPPLLIFGSQVAGGGGERHWAEGGDVSRGKSGMSRRRRGSGGRQRGGRGRRGERVTSRRRRGAPRRGGGERHVPRAAAPGASEPSDFVAVLQMAVMNIAAHAPACPPAHLVVAGSFLCFIYRSWMYEHTFCWERCMRARNWTNLCFPEAGLCSSFVHGRQQNPEVSG